MKVKVFIVVALVFFSMQYIFAFGAKESKEEVQTVVVPTGPQKVILDTDMTECFDDGVAMIVLEQAESIDLLGVTVVAGNSSMPSGVSNGVKQLEIMGSNTPIYEGSRVGIRTSRQNPDFMETELRMNPIIAWGGYLRHAADPEAYAGMITMDTMAEWQDVYRYRYSEDPTYQYVYGPSNPDANGNKNAVDFMIEQVNKYPGEIVIAAIGPMTNVAMAILKDPTFPSKVKEIVYMGGSFYLPGNANAAAEFNWWADPDAAQICVRSAWGDVNSESYKTYGNQMISGLEANQNSGGMPQDLYEKMLENTWPGLRELFEKNNGNTAPDMIWDVFTVAYLIDPTVVLSWNNQPIPENGEAEDIHGVYIDVNTEMTQDYGRSLAYSATKGPAGSKKAAIQNYIDEDKFWNEIVYPALVP